MDWNLLLDCLFFLGASACSGFLVYGGWLCCLGPSGVPLNDHSKADCARTVRFRASSAQISSRAAMSLLVAGFALGACEVLGYLT